MQSTFEFLDPAATAPLSRALTSSVLESIAHLEPSRLVYGQPDSPRLLQDNKLPPISRRTSFVPLPISPRTVHIEPAIVTILEGSFDVYMNERLYRAQKGDWLLFPHGVPHREFCLPDRTNYRAVWFYRNPTSPFLGQREFRRRDRFHIFFYKSSSRSLTSLFSEIDDILENPNMPLESLKQGLIHILSWWLDALTDDLRIACRQLHPLVEKAMTILENPKSVRLCVSDIAKEVGVSLSYLSHLFHQQTGLTISKTIQKKRIQHACAYLTESTKSIKEIAFLLGFTTPQHFNHLFRKSTGINPMYYREHSVTKTDKR